MDSLRVMASILSKDEYLDELLELLNSHAGLVEEVVFFTTPYHCAARLEEFSRVLERMPHAFAKIRKAGYRVGINHLTTTGHHDENLSIAADASLQRQVGLDGQICHGALCPANAAVQEYVCATYKLFANVQPDIIWIDDDVRLGGHMPTYGTCICDGCIKEFSEEINELFTHSLLVAAFNDSNFERRSTIRRRFMERNTRIIANLLSLIEKTVHAISPSTELGFMTGDRFWEGYGFESWAKSLSTSAGLPVRWRPGGGFYSDEKPIDLVGKVHDVGRQCSLLSEDVSIVQGEVENFPYQPLRKARQNNMLEMTGYLFAGCSGNALNILGDDPKMLHEHKPLVDYLHNHVAFWNELKATLAGTELLGIWPAWDSMQMAAGDAGQVASFFGDIYQSMSHPYSLLELGVPVCYSPDDAVAVAISGRMPLAIGMKRMKSLLASGVLLDGEAAQTLEEMGLVAYVGVKVGQCFDKDTVERFNDHPRNGLYSNAYRDCRQSFNKIKAYELLPLSKKVETLAYLADYQGQSRGASVTCYENSLGGRVAVQSYFPWTLNQSLAKREQLLTLCDWLSYGTMLLRIHTLARIYPWVRRNKTGGLVIGLLNLSADTYDALHISINTECASFRRLMLNGDYSPIDSHQSKLGEELTLDNIKPHSFEVIVVDGN